MSYTLLMIVKDGEVVAEREASPDMVIALLAQMVTNNPPQATETEAPLPATSKRPKERAVKKDKGGRKPGQSHNCSGCGKPGHSIRTCPNARGMHPDNPKL